MEKLPQESLWQYCRRIILGGVDRMHAHARWHNANTAKAVDDYSEMVNPIISHLYVEHPTLVKNVIEEFIPSFTQLGWRRLNPSNLFPRCKSV